MAWDKNKPSGSQKIRLSDEEIRANWDALEDALSREHIFPGEYGNTAGVHTDEFIAKVIHSAFPAGTKMLFVQASAPTGWTKVTDWDDRVIRVVSGDGGGTGGSWTISGLSWSGSVASAGGHQHAIPMVFEWNAQTLRVGSNNYGTRDVSSYMTKGGGITYSDESRTTQMLTSNDGEHTHGINGSISSDGSWRPAFVDVICCQKD